MPMKKTKKRKVPSYAGLTDVEIADMVREGRDCALTWWLKQVKKESGKGTSAAREAFQFASDYLRRDADPNGSAGVPQEIVFRYMKQDESSSS